MDNIQSNIDDTKKENDELKRRLNYLEDKITNFVSSTSKELSSLKIENNTLLDKNIELNKKVRNLNIILEEYFKRVEFMESKIVHQESESEFIDSEFSRNEFVSTSEELNN
jgi:predicted  nucleic acid-binding Zn-ribbon protein